MTSKARIIIASNVLLVRKSYSHSVRSIGTRILTNYMLNKYSNKPNYLSRRNITENSWAKERFDEIGVKLEPAPELPLVTYSDDLINNAPDNIKKLGEEVLSLNVIEMNQLMKYIQVI
jgi:hypothetical protein